MMTEPLLTEDLTEEQALPVQLRVQCSKHVFSGRPITFDRWAAINYFVGPNGSGKTTLFNAAMEACRNCWPTRVKTLGTGRLGPLEKSVTQWVGELSRLFQEDDIKNVYGQLASRDTSHEAFQILEKRLDLQIRVLGFLRHVFKRDLHFKSTRKGLQVFGASFTGEPYAIIDECHGIKELITILTFLYDDTFSVLGIDEPELHLHPQFQRFLVDELRAVAGDPAQPGKKLIFLVTHSPILLEMRTLADLASVIMFSLSSQPERAHPWLFLPEERLKVKQCLPSFHTGQRELLFSSVPIVVEGPTDASVLLNVASKLCLPLGAAGVGVAPMGGKYQLLAFRALFTSLAKPDARFVLDLDAALDTKAMACLDGDPRVLKYLASNGLGDRTLTRLIGELITLLRSYLSAAATAGAPVSDVISVEEADTKTLGVALRAIREQNDREPECLFDQDRVRAILGKADLIRAAAQEANVLVLSRGPIEAYYESPPSARAKDFEKQQALQVELEAIWQSAESTLEGRYAEVLSFFRDSGFLKIPITEQVREPLAHLIHLLQTEVVKGRIKSLEDAVSSPRLTADGYWHICELVKLDVFNEHDFRGAVKVKDELGGELVHFDNSTRAYEISDRRPGNATAHSIEGKGASLCS